MLLLDPETFGWDLTIIVLLCLSLASVLCAFCWYQRKRGKRLMRIAATAWMLISCVAFCTLIYGSFIEPRLLITRTYGVPFAVDEQLRIVVMSDMHVGPYKGRMWVQKAVERANSLLPDLVLLPGDFILGDTSDATALLELQKLRTTMGVFAVLGNHDVGRIGWTSEGGTEKRNRGEEIEGILTQAGVQVLRNAHVEVKWGDDELIIAGIDDLWSDTSDVSSTLDAISGGAPVLLLSHNPSIVENPTLRGRVELVVSGHTHAGQLRLPGLGPILGVPTSLGDTYDEGYFVYENIPLFITRGIGESGPRARLFAPPEVSLLLTQ